MIPGTRHLPGLIGGRDPREWYSVERIDHATFAIHERRYWQKNVNYLIVGEQRALLFDTGSGLSDVRSVCSQLTELPVTAMASHVHWDHIGCHSRFQHVAAPRITPVVDKTTQGTYRSTRRSTLAPRRRTFTVTDWIEPGQDIELGGRTLRCLHTPGHTPDSVSLHDSERGLVFTGDFLYDGPIAFGSLPGQDLPTARQSAILLAGECGDAAVHGGHYGALPAGRLSAFAQALGAIASGASAEKGHLIRRYNIEGFHVLIGPRRYPTESD